MLTNKVYKKEVMKNNVKLTIISTPILILDETKGYLKEFVKEFKLAEKANKIHTYAKISMEISYNSTVELRRVTQLKVTKTNLKVTIQNINENGEGYDVEYTTLNFPISIIKSIEARVI